MTSTNWKLSDDQTVAEYVPLEDFEGILQQRIGIGPDHVALLIRDGRLVETYHGAHFSVGGLWRKLKSVIGGKHAVRLLVADLKPFAVEGDIDGVSRDQVPVAAATRFEFQLNPERPQNILGLMQERSALTRQDLYQRLMPHLRDRVFASVLRQVDAFELRGNPSLQDKLQADVMRETERLFGDLGLMVRGVSLTWGLNEEERSALAERKRQREQAALDREFARRKQELERESEAREFVVSAEVAAETLKASSEDELRQLFLQQELSFVDARDKGVRQQQLNKLSHEIDVLNIERRATYVKALEDAQNALEQAQLRRQLAEVDLETEQMQALQRLKLERLQQEQGLDIADRARCQQLETMRGLSDVELDSESRRRGMAREDRRSEHQMELERKRLEAEGEVAKLQAQGAMSPEQILAINAGLSPEVARIFAERARTEALGAEKQQALLREMLALSQSNQARSDEQTRFFYERGIQGVVAASQGRQTGEGKAGAGDAGAEPEGTVVCPGCQREVSAGDRYCRFCRHPLSV
jgi:hypothetical protein